MCLFWEMCLFKKNVLIMGNLLTMENVLIMGNWCAYYARGQYIDSNWPGRLRINPK